MANENSVQYPPETPVTQINRRPRLADQDLSGTEHVRNRHSRSSVNSPDSTFSPTEDENDWNSPPIRSASSPNTPLGDYFYQSENIESDISPSAATRGRRRSARFLGIPPAYGPLEENRHLIHSTTNRIPSSESNAFQNAPSILLNSTGTPIIPTPLEDLSPNNQRHTPDSHSHGESFPRTASQTSAIEQAIDAPANGSFRNRAVSPPSLTPAVPKPIFEKYHAYPLTDFDIKEKILEALKRDRPYEKRRSRTIASSGLRATSRQPTNINPEPKVDGYVYINKSPAVPGYVKIGYTKNIPATRRKQWHDKCGLIIEAVDDPHQKSLPHFRLVERLIHLQLAKYERKFRCWKCKSAGKEEHTMHHEWFEISEETAVHVARGWRDWMVDCKPYDCHGRLTRYWVEKCNLLSRVSGDVDWDEWRKPLPLVETSYGIADDAFAGSTEFASEVDDICQSSLDIADRAVVLCLTIFKIEVVLSVVLFIACRVSVGVGAILFLFVVRGRRTTFFKDEPRASYLR